MTLSGSRSQILVTGGAGYIGGCLVKGLVAFGHHVRVLDSLLYGDAGIRAAIGHPRLEMIVGDIRGQKTVRRSLEGVGTVVHLAALVGDPACALLPDLAVAVNQDATGLLLELAEASD